MLRVRSNRRRVGRPPGDARDAEASRRELLEAAAVEFATHGYAAATVDAIASRAGLSKGTFYWTFDSKADAFVALLEDRLDAPARVVLEALDRTPPDSPTAPAISQGLADLFSNDLQMIRLLHEYWAAATRDEEHAARYRRRHEALRGALAAGLAHRHDETGVPMTMPAEELAEAFVALAVGLGMAALVSPDSIREGLFGDVASLVYDGMVLRAGTTTGGADD